MNLNENGWMVWVVLEGEEGIDKCSNKILISTNTTTTNNNNNVRG